MVDKEQDKAAEARPASAPRVDAQKGEATGIKEATRTAHEQRVTVPDAPNVDARLDNRTGADRPPLETFPAKPQQVDGPDVMHQVEHTRATLNKDALGKDVKDAGPRKGMFSPGPHGLSDEAVREAETEAKAGKG